ncbi:MAG: ribonucleoside triphosphate reductase [bacterium]
MFTEIKKRNGQIVAFDQQKIAHAITKAGEASGEFSAEGATQLTQLVLMYAEKQITAPIPSVEQVQDIVEEVLLNSPYKKTAKTFIIYRDQHAKIREIITKSGVDLIDQYLCKLDWQVKENSNMSYSLQGLNNYIASETSKVYWLNKIYTPAIKDAHANGDLHIHDLGQLSVYCVGWDLYDLLTVGFTGASGKIQSKPAKHFRTALGQIVNFFYTLQGEAAGAQAFSSFDTLLAPFIRYDKLTYEQVKQALQEFVFNINVPTRVGFQTPFTNITMDLTVPSTYANNAVMIAGKPQKETYAEFQPEMDMLNQAFMEVMVEGDAQGRVFTFPIPTYNITRDFDWDNPKLNILWEATAKYGIPYFANFVNSDMSPEDARSMCCRLRLDTRQLLSKGGGLFGANPLTGSIGVVTINLPRLGYKAESEEQFYTLLEEVMQLAKQSLETKRKILETLTESGLYPYTKFYLRDIQMSAQQYWKNHFSTIGLIGLNEVCLNLLGTNIASTAGQVFSQKVLDFMRNRLVDFQQETGNNYNLEATPAEATTYRLALLDKKHFPGIIVANEEHLADGAQPFYTNSSQLPVSYTEDIFEALDLQDGLQTRYTGGTVLHLFCGEKIYHPESVKLLVRKVCDSYALPYFTLTPTFSVCPSHGYLNGEQNTCPQCASNCEVYSRVVGYLRPVQQWNEGKQSEFVLRKMFSVEQALDQDVKKEVEVSSEALAV